MSVVRTDQAVEAVERSAQVGHAKFRIGLQPCAEQIFVFNEVADVISAIFHHHDCFLVFMIFYKCHNILISPSDTFQIVHLIVLQEFIED